MARPNMIKATRRAIKDSPREIFNWYLLMCTCIWSFSGVAKGFDEGNIASLVIMEVFKERFGIDKQTDHQYANTKGWIVAIATAGAVFGCLGCVWLTQRLGRTRTFQFFTVVYMAGIFGQTFSSGNPGALYATRVIAGIGVGATTVLPSVYIAEISPQPIRGLLTLQYTCCQQLGVVFSFFFNYGVTKYHAGTNLQWQLPTALQLIPALIWGVGTFFTPETPRFLLRQNKRTEALATLSRFRGLPEDHSYVQSEFQGIESQLNHEIEIVSGANTWDLIKETFTDLSNRRRFVLMFACHVFGQWSGANAVTQYSPTIFGYLGIEGTEARFLATGCYAILKFVSVLIFSVFVIDFIGRPYLKVTNGWTPEKIEASSSAMAATRAAIAAIYIHAIAWSIGWFSIPYLVSAEVFPLRIRSINVSILMAVHWAMYFDCSRAMLVSFWFIPNFPDSTGTYFITEEEAAMAQYRQTVSAGGIAEDDAGSYWDGFWMCMKEPFAHLFAAIHFFLIIAQSYKDFFPSIVATIGFSGTTTYLIQAPPPIIAFIAMMGISWSSGRRLEHGYHIIVPILLTLIGCAVMITTLNVGARYFSMILLVVGPFVGLNIQISWETTVVPRPRTKRAALIAYANCVSSVSHWFTPYFFLRNQEPYYQTGGGVIIAGCGLVVVFVLITKWYVAKKNKALKAAEDAAGEPEGWRFAG
ncbi:quinate transport [Fusarium subglutinans]|uniref:Quinate transport n=1 Tax=Gibberella subglutinans TaxID=42677 RepID=A0A8H5PDA9_GIBSU|nr:quinate transport [Fusarium subglutinans]KAF5594585.1 quinate transport [Fusarium subglutinans]